MLNRKFSNYLFYLLLVAITVVVLLVRVVLIGNMDSKIASLETNNILLEAQILSLEKTVEDNQDIQIDHLYELYSQIPNYFTATELSYYTVAQLELIGISEASDIQRSVAINDKVSFPIGSIFAELGKEFKIVEVSIYFTTQDAQVISDFVDLLYNADQVFIVNYLDYYAPDGINYIGVTISFLAFYDKDAS